MSHSQSELILYGSREKLTKTNVQIDLFFIHTVSFYFFQIVKYIKAYMNMSNLKLSSHNLCFPKKIFLTSNKIL